MFKKRTYEKHQNLIIKRFSGAFSLTKTATGILFKFSNTDDYHAVYKKGFHKITGARFYKKVKLVEVYTIYKTIFQN